MAKNGPGMNIVFCVVTCKRFPTTKDCRRNVANPSQAAVRGEAAAEQERRDMENADGEGLRGVQGLGCRDVEEARYPRRGSVSLSRPFSSPTTHERDNVSVVFTHFFADPHFFPPYLRLFRPHGLPARELL